MVYSLAYTRPPHVDASRGSLNGQEKQQSVNESITSSNACSMNCGIPEALSFDKIINGGTCPVRSFCPFPPLSGSLLRFVDTACHYRHDDSSKREANGYETNSLLRYATFSTTSNTLSTLQKTSSSSCGIATTSASSTTFPRTKSPCRRNGQCLSRSPRRWLVNRKLVR